MSLRDRNNLHDDCEFDRLGVLTPAEGQMVTAASIRTWALLPWLQQMGVSAETTRELLRAMFLMYGWRKFLRLPAGIELPRVPGMAPHPFELLSAWTAYQGELRDDIGKIITKMTVPSWWMTVAEHMRSRWPGPITLLADASTSGEELLRITAMAQLMNMPLHLVIETDESFQPYAALPLALAEAPIDSAVLVRRDDRLRTLAASIAARSPCCGEMAPPMCARECEAVYLAADGFSLVPTGDDVIQQGNPGLRTQGAAWRSYQHEVD